MPAPTMMIRNGGVVGGDIQILVVRWVDVEVSYWDSYIRGGYMLNMLQATGSALLSSVLGLLVVIMIVPGFPSKIAYSFVVSRYT